MAISFKFFLIHAVTIAFCVAQEEEVGGTCVLASAGAEEQYGQCVLNKDCDGAGTFVPSGDDFPLLDSSFTIDCPDQMTCCRHRGPEVAAQIKQGCGLLLDGVGTAPPGFARPQEVPWTVAILVRKNTALQFATNGVLIHERAVLTVAHKPSSLSDLDTSRIFISVGDYDQAVANSSKKVITAQEVVIHPQFNKDTAEYDLAVIILSNSVPASLTYVAPICLPSQGHEVVPNTNCFFTGWGNVPDKKHEYKLTKTEVPIMARERCSLAQRPRLGLFYTVSSSLMCVGGVPGTNLCIGDGGAPLVCPIENQPGRYQLTGLLAYVSECDLPVVFADVAGSRSWIDSVLTTKGLIAP